ncbi:helix-turn-helix domain-containing protein [Streptomyces avidinii]|uniref:helix-turn-helix domain-containing protein n=1 Tax=Streptomyces avidinii TaxID=1895 RepID=UPI001675612A|nr:helix-turn-helix transcriptional regulator [Streptomyces avidinii]
MPVGGRPTVRSRRLGAALRRHREAAGLDQATAAAAILRSVSKVSRLEGGQSTASALEVRTLLNCYGVDDPDERARLEGWAKSSNQRGWWLDYQETLRSGYTDHITLENDATYIRSWQPALIPGLLQTTEYAEAVIASAPTFIEAERAARLVQVRQERQKRIYEGTTQFAAVIWEPAITSMASTPAIAHPQWRLLLEAGERHNVTVQMLPASASRAAGIAGPFVSFSFGVEPTVEAVAVENLPNTSVIEAPDDLALYVNVFDRLRSTALSPEQTAERIRLLLKDTTPVTREGS